MDSVASIGRYEFSLLHDLVKLLPKHPKARQEVFGQQNLDALIQQMAFALFIIRDADERERTAVLGTELGINPTQAQAFLSAVRSETVRPPSPS